MILIYLTGVLVSLPLHFYAHRFAQRQENKRRDNFETKYHFYEFENIDIGTIIFNIIMSIIFSWIAVVGLLIMFLVSLIDFRKVNALLGKRPFRKR